MGFLPDNAPKPLVKGEFAKADEMFKKYNPQNEMFVNRKTKRYIFKTKRIFFGYPSIIQKMWL